MPVDFGVLLAFVGTVLFLVLSPGPDTILILRYTAGSGRSVGLAAVAGVQLGLAVHTLAAAVGLSLVIAASPTALAVVAGLGALYLGWLGIQSFRAGMTPIGRIEGAARVTGGKACRDALLTNLLNPKVLLLFFALMPQFVVAGRSPVPLQLGALGAVLILVNTVWQSVLVRAADQFRSLLGSPAVQRVVSILTGTVLVAFALLLVRDYLT